jgi:hypothetical protein
MLKRVLFLPSLLLIALAASHTVCPAQDSPAPKQKPYWATSYMITREGDDKDTALDGFDVSQGPEHLLGGWALVRQRKGAPLLIHGHLTKMGEFTANVSLEVSDQKDGDWRIIESSLSEKVDVTLTAAPHIEMLFFRIQLDALQPYIGKFRYWRIVLQTGEIQILPMAWLTEDGESKER